MITILDIQREVAGAFGVRMIDILSERRGTREAYPRMAAYLLARDLTPQSLPRIGRSFMRDHTTVLHGIRVAERRMAEHPAYAAKVNQVRAALLDRVKNAYV
jgi:chromosomal replication initiator protein